MRALDRLARVYDKEMTLFISHPSLIEYAALRAVRPIETTLSIYSKASACLRMRSTAFMTRALGCLNLLMTDVCAIRLIAIDIRFNLINDSKIDFRKCQS